MLHQHLLDAEARNIAAEAALQKMRRNGAPSEQYVHTLSSLPVKPGDLAMMTYATGGVREMLYNWVLHVQRLELPILVSAMDKDVVMQCAAQRFHCLDWSHTAAAADTSYVRGSFDGFRALGVRKLDALLPVLRAGIHIVLSDVDCVWSSSPLPMFEGRIRGFEDFLHADVIVATDCMSPDLDSPKDENAPPSCYRDTVDKNTGILAVRATDDGIKTMAEWKVRLKVGQKDEQDQTTFNDLLDGNGRGHRWGMDWPARHAFRQFGDGWCAPAKRENRGFNAIWEKSADGTSHNRGSRHIFTVCFPNVTRTARIGVFPIHEVTPSLCSSYTRRPPSGPWLSTRPISLAICPIIHSASANASAIGACGLLMTTMSSSAQHAIWCLRTTHPSLRARVGRALTTCTFAAAST